MLANQISGKNDIIPHCKHENKLYGVGVDKLYGVRTGHDVTPLNGLYITMGLGSNVWMGMRKYVLIIVI